VVDVGPGPVVTVVVDVTLAVVLEVVPVLVVLAEVLVDEVVVASPDPPDPPVPSVAPCAQAPDATPSPTRDTTRLAVERSDVDEREREARIR
jgi:hypothetical protein